MEREDPLLNPIIVSNILDHVMTVQDIISCRSVCSLWNELGFKQWRSLVTLNLCNSSADTKWSVEDFWHHQNDPDDPHQLTGKPFKRFIFNEINLSEHPLLQNVDDENTDTFWNKMGPIITYVQFRKCIFAADRPELFEKILAEKLPNLKTLILVDNITTRYQIWLPRRTRLVARFAYPDPRVSRLVESDLRLYRNNVKRNTSLTTIQISGMTPMNFSILLLNSPNLQRLILGKDRIVDEVYWYCQRQFLIACQMKFHLDNEPFQLTHLDVMKTGTFYWDGFFDSDNHEMDHIKFKLKYLTVDLPRLGVNKCLSKLCGNFRAIEQLHVFRTSQYSIRLSKTPFKLTKRMDSLRELYLYGNVLKDLTCLKHLPNLKVLVVDPKCHGNLEHLRRAARWEGKFKPNNGIEMINSENRAEMKMEQMERLHLNTKTFRLVCATPLTARLKTLVEWMPNLKTLETNLNIKGFRAVCRLLPRLEEIVLLFDSKIGDEAVTGLKPTEETDPNPNNITSFSNLKKFELRTRCDVSNQSDENRLGDKSVYKGFLKMSTLQSVKISVSRKMTDVAVEHLKMHVPHVQLIRNYDDSQSHGNGECCAINTVERELKM